MSPDGETRVQGRAESSEAAASRVRLNVGLYAATIVLGCAAVLLGVVLAKQDVETEFWKSSFWKDSQSLPAPAKGEKLGKGTVQAVEPASDEEVRRTAAQLEAARRMVEAFTNLDHEDPAASMDTVRELSTGEFREQYDAGAADLERLAVEAKSTMKSRVVWTGLVVGDQDSATVTVATNGTVTNKTTKFEEETVVYRIVVQLVLEDEQWLVNDLEFVR